uniref:Uncharacterized protein n=1 Tax=Ditylenchus dipsaci TaxID=166011 RepID=A0A915E7N5_9BILA
MQQKRRLGNHRSARHGKVRIARLSVRIFGSAQTGWRNKLSEQVYESKELILDEYKDLTSDLSMHCSEALEILEGQHKIHFKINFHWMWCRVLRRKDMDMSNTRVWLCWTSLKEGIAKLWQNATSARPKGWISAEVEVNELGILPGETVRISLTIENTVKRRMQETFGCTSVHTPILCQQLDFRAGNRLDHRLVDQKSLTTAVHSCGTCKANLAKGLKPN